MIYIGIVVYFGVYESKLYCIIEANYVHIFIIMSLINNLLLNIHTWDLNLICIISNHSFLYTILCVLHIMDYIMELHDA
ncbi:hypothetical protein Hanom_Chr05g00412591 [Helianthus anomalus]